MSDIVSAAIMRWRKGGFSPSMNCEFDVESGQCWRIAMNVCNRIGGSWFFNFDKCDDATKFVRTVDQITEHLGGPDGDAFWKWQEARAAEVTSGVDASSPQTKQPLLSQAMKRWGEHGLAVHAEPKYGRTGLVWMLVVDSEHAAMPWNLQIWDTDGVERLVKRVDGVLEIMDAAC